MSKPCAKWKRALPAWRPNEPACSPVPPGPLCGSAQHPAVAEYQALVPGVNQARRDALEREVKQLAEAGALVRGELDALLKQQQKEATEKHRFCSRSKRLPHAGRRRSPD